MIGKTIAHYEITSLIGKGGMGEVYRARDTKLDRDVAIKLLPREVASDPDRLARFRREAKLLATLNHPAIGALYGIEETDGAVFLVMELVEGEDLDKRLRGGAMAVDDVLKTALQIAEALEAAHAKSIVHRDLKPANVMISPSGRIKLLDFGLARAFHDDADDGDPAMSPTITAAMTEPGMILGTAAYMSPEQARGKTADRQSDIWAFGVVLYQMLTGRSLFAGETVSDSIGAILHKDPDWTRLPTHTPPQVRQLLARCLERDRELRLHDVAEARVALLDAQRDPEGSRLGLSVMAKPDRSSSKSTLVGLAALVGVVIGLGLSLVFFSADTPRPYRVFDLGIDFQPSDVQRVGIQAAISPDGSAVVYTHGGELWVHNLDEQQPIALAQTEDAIAPFWSPDGTQVGWFEGSKLWRMPVKGGRPIALSETQGRIAGGVGAHWGEQGRILFSIGSSGIFAVSERGGVVTELIGPGEGYGDLHEPHGLRGDRGILFVGHPEERGPSTLEFWRDGERRVLFEAAANSRIWCPCYDPAGFVLFRLTQSDLTDGLWAMAFDAGAGEARGEPFLVEPDASEGTLSHGGTLVYVMNPQRSSERVVARVGFDGQIQETLTSPRAGNLEFALSPDGRKLAFTAFAHDGGPASQIWIRDLLRGVEFQLTSDENQAIFQLKWSADSETIEFVAVEVPDGSPEFVTMLADGSGPWTTMADVPGLLAPSGDQIVVVTGPRGEPLAFEDPDTTEVWLQALGDPDSRRQVLGGDGQYFPSRFSPSGDFLLYFAVRGNAESTFLTRFPEFTGRWKVTLGTEVRAEDFAPDESAIYYVSDEDLFRVAFAGGTTPELGRPERIGSLPAISLGSIQIHPEGDSYLTTVDAQAQNDSERPRRVKIVQNWTAKLEPR